MPRLPGEFWDHSKHEANEDAVECFVVQKSGNKSKKGNFSCQEVRFYHRRRLKGSIWNLSPFQGLSAGYILSISQNWNVPLKAIFHVSKDGRQPWYQLKSREHRRRVLLRSTGMHHKDQEKNKCISASADVKVILNILPYTGPPKLEVAHGGGLRANSVLHISEKLPI